MRQTSCTQTRNCLGYFNSKILRTIGWISDFNRGERVLPSERAHLSCTWPFPTTGNTVITHTGSPFSMYPGGFDSVLSQCMAWWPAGHQAIAAIDWADLKRNGALSLVRTPHTQAVPLSQKVIFHCIEFSSGRWVPASICGVLCNGVARCALPSERNFLLKCVDYMEAKREPRFS